MRWEVLLREVAALESELAAFGGRAAGRLSCAAGGTIRGSGHRPSGRLSGRHGVARRDRAAPLRRCVADRRRCPHLPSVPTELLFMTNAVRAELGLATAERAQQAQAALLAALLASVPRVVATWRSHRGDEPNPLSPLLERLQFVARRVLGDDMLREPARDVIAVDSVALAPPAPSAAPLLPDRVSASHAQSLVDCPYQFYARRLLRLAELDDVIEAPENAISARPCTSAAAVSPPGAPPISAPSIPSS
jgi:hypothetical protein